MPSGNQLIANEAHVKYVIRNIIHGILLSFLCLFIQHSDYFLSTILKAKVNFKRESVGHWSADISHLSHGIYYISLGHPRAVCELWVDGRIVDTNRSAIAGIKTKLFVGGTVISSEAKPAKRVQIRCEKEPSDMRRSIGVYPVLAEYRVGMFIQDLRQILEVFFGPFFTIAFVVCILINLRSSHRPIFERGIHLSLAINAFLYSISSTHFIRTIIPSGIASLIHIYLKNLYAASLALFIGSYIKNRSWVQGFVWIFYIGLFGLLLIATFFFRGQLGVFYGTEYILFIIPILVLVIELMRDQSQASHVKILQMICICYLIIQISDYLVISGYLSISHSSPAFVALAACSLGYLKYQETLADEQNKQRLQFDLESSKKLAKMAAQVAHDLRSPIAALHVLESDLTELPDDKRTLLCSVIHRVRDIANELLDRKKSLENSNSSASSPQIIAPRSEQLQSPSEGSILMLSSLVESIVAEKQVEFRNRSGIEIIHSQGLSDHRLFAEANSRELGRILSNLISNGVEAISQTGSVNLCLHERVDEVWIEVRDTGIGISDEILPRLMLPGGTFGKTGGNGLGLFHAKTSVEAWKGRLEIESELGQGTLVRICLPLIKVPSPVGSWITH